jgi:hypothetical protein
VLEVYLERQGQRDGLVVYVYLSFGRVSFVFAES